MNQVLDNDKSKIHMLFPFGYFWFLENLRENDRQRNQGGKSQGKEKIDLKLINYFDIYFQTHLFIFHFLHKVK